MLLTRSADIPQRAEPSLHDIGDMLQSRHRTLELDNERHANQVRDLKAALKARKRKTGKHAKTAPR
jgi:hypothetical protein